MIDSDTFSCHILALTIIMALFEVYYLSRFDNLRQSSFVSVLPRSILAQHYERTCIHTAHTGGVASIEILGGPDRYKKSMICLEGRLTLFSSSLLFLPAILLSPSRTLEGLFELTWHPSRALDLPRALLLELQRYKDTARCAALGTESQDNIKNYWRKP